MLSLIRLEIAKVTKGICIFHDIVKFYFCEQNLVFNQAQMLYALSFQTIDVGEIEDRRFVISPPTIGLELSIITISY